MNLLKKVTFSLVALIIVILVVSTILEKTCGTSYVSKYIYNSTHFISLWIILSLSAAIYAIKRGLLKKPITMMLHFSFIVILIGALITHIYSEEGALHLRQGVGSSIFINNDGMGHKMPFMVSLDKFQVKYYAVSNSPSDYQSKVTIIDGDKNISSELSMNNILTYRGYRFYQASFDSDEMGTTLLVNYDPIGIAITYIGYFSLFIAMLLFLLSPKSRFWKLIREIKINSFTLSLLIVLLFPISTYSKEAPNVLPKEQASKFERISVIYNGRVAPLRIVMDDFMLKLYGSISYNELTSSQLFTGLMFFPDSWKEEKIIKINDDNICSILDVDGKYASINELHNSDGKSKLDGLVYENIGDDPKLLRDLNKINEKFYLAYITINGEWLSSSIEILGKDSAQFDRWMTEVKSSIIGKNYLRLDSLITDIKSYQSSLAGKSLPTSSRVDAELVYNKMRNHNPISIILMILGVISFLYFGLIKIDMIKVSMLVIYFLNAILITAFVYITIIISLRWYVGGHIPLSNGYETMQFMSWCILLFALLLQKKFTITISFGLLLSGVAFMVSTLGETNPQITHLAPVLSSPLLSVHVVMIMMSYSLFAFMSLNGVMAFLLKISSQRCDNQIKNLQIYSTILLYPAIFLLTAGIFTGAIWANISWGRYWAWDPKEVWALITMLIYSFPLHHDSLPLFKKEMFFHLYTIIAFLSVLFTYFGVNYILGGMHSYA